MWPELIAFLREPLVMLVMGAGVLVGAACERARTSLRRDRRGRAVGRSVGGAAGVRSSWPDAADQLRIVMNASFSAKAVLNRGEARLYKALEQAVMELAPDWRVLAQVSLGELITSPDPLAHSCINAKRVDLLLMDGDGRPRHVVEYQGQGHHQGSAAARDAVKREALRRAGVGFHEVIAGITRPSDVRRLAASLIASSPKALGAERPRVAQPAARIVEDRRCASILPSRAEAVSERPLNRAGAF